MRKFIRRTIRLFQPDRYTVHLDDGGAGVIRDRENPFVFIRHVEYDHARLDCLYRNMEWGAS